MGNISIVHGIIKVTNIDTYDSTIKSLGLDENYPWINPEMFNLSAREHPYYYEDPIATFGATYKNLEGGVSLEEFILKFEYLLMQVDFDFARIRLETEYMGDYEFFWGAKNKSNNDFYDNNGLIEMDKWFFGYGKRHMFGGLEQENEPETPHQFQYPIQFNPTMKDSFNSIIPELNKLEKGTKHFIKRTKVTSIIENDHSHLILTYLKLNKILEFGWEAKKGLFIIRHNEINEIKNPYNNTYDTMSC